MSQGQDPLINSMKAGSHPPAVYEGLASATRYEIEQILRPAKSATDKRQPADGHLSKQVAALEAELERLGQAERALLESNDALTLLSETASELLSSDKPREVINALFQKLSARLGLEMYFNYLVEEDSGKLRLSSYAGITPEAASEIEWLEYGQAVCGCVARDGCRIVAEDIQQSDDVRTDLVRSFGVTAYACHPLIAHDRIIGTFSFGTTKKERFERHELALMQAVCDQVSMAMNRMLLISELRKREAAQRFLAEASAVLSSSLDYEVTLPAFAKLAVGHVADWCVVDVDEGGKRVRWLASAQQDERSIAMASEIERFDLLDPERSPVLIRAAKEQRPTLHADLATGGLEDMAASHRERSILSQLGAASAIVVPLRGRNGTLGTITLIDAHSERHYGQEEMEIAEELAYRAAISVENARLYREARDAIRMRDEFLSVAAHELKTPLTSLRGFAQAVIRQAEKGQFPDPARVNRALRVIDLQSDKLSRLVSQLLDISRIEGGKLILERSRVEIGQLAKGVVEAAQLTSADRQIVLHVHEPIWCLVDPLRLEQVLRNLLDNATRFSPQGTRIDLDIWSPGIGTVRISVRDRGMGIPRKHRDRVFDRFYQANAASYSSGMGLGLYISRHILELHGGSIEVESPSDGGARFVITLPTAMAEVKRQWEERKS